MKFLLNILLFFYFTNSFGQAPSIQWAKCFGGSHDDQSYSIVQTYDGGFIVAGVAKSDDGQVVGMHNSFGTSEDIWLLRLDSAGNILWQKCLGGSIGEGAMSISATIDSGFIIAGYASSTDGDVVGGYFADNDFWIIKIDSIGNIQWQKVTGGSQYDTGIDASQISNGKFIVCGRTESNDRDVMNFHGFEDYWVLKFTQNGIVEWSKTLGGYGFDLCSGIRETSDGGYLVVGSSTSNDSNVIGNHGSSDAWLVKLDSSGNELWNKCYGGTGDEGASYARVLQNGDIILSGNTSSNDGDISGSHGGTDIWVFKINNAGILKWSKCYGDVGFDGANTINTTSDSGFIILGSTNSSNGIATGNHGIEDILVMKIDSSGNYEWSMCLGGSNYEDGYSVMQTRDGGYILCGETKSNNGDVSGSHGIQYYDYWVVKLSPLTNNLSEQNSILDFSTYFNSETHNLRIHFNDDRTEKIMVKLFDVTGRNIYRQKIEGESGINEKEIHLDECASGIYLLNLETEKGTQTEKVMIWYE